MADQVAFVLCMKGDPSGHLVCGALYEPCLCHHSLSVRSGVSTRRKTEFPILLVMNLRSLVEVTDVPESRLPPSFKKLIEIFTKGYLIIRQQRYRLGYDTLLSCNWLPVYRGNMLPPPFACNAEDGGTMFV